MIDKPLGLDEDATGIWSNVKWKAAPSKPFSEILSRNVQDRATSRGARPAFWQIVVAKRV
jgi:hypothetical protein